MTDPKRTTRDPRRAPPEVVRALARLLSARVGLRPAPESETGLRLAIAARLTALGEADAAAYLERIQKGDGQELRALLPLVTVGKTEFFRDAVQQQALQRTLLPQLLERARAERRPMRLWSAGCATGEEPYSLAMLALELGAAPGEVELLATDVNPAAVAAAELGRFPAKRMRAVPGALMDRFWCAEHEELSAAPCLRACVRFAVHNLVAEAFPSPEGGAWDLIACRNVMIYFDAPTAARVVRGFFERLREGGILCLGYSESLFRVSSDFELAEVDGAFVYRRRLAPPPSAPARWENPRATASRSNPSAARAPAPVAPAGRAALARGSGRGRGERPRSRSLRGGAGGVAPSARARARKPGSPDHARERADGFTPAG